MTTKRDFEATARILSEAMSVNDPGKREMVVFIAEMFVNRYKAENPRFDRARFLKACGIVP